MMFRDSAPAKVHAMYKYVRFEVLVEGSVKLERCATYIFREGK
jgi:hypothetical protein